MGLPTILVRRLRESAAEVQDVRAHVHRTPFDELVKELRRKLDMPDSPLTDAYDSGAVEALLHSAIAVPGATCSNMSEIRKNKAGM